MLVNPILKGKNFLEVITSVKNELVVKTKKIKQEPTGKLFLENPKLIKEAFNANLCFDYCLISVTKQANLIANYSFLKQTNLIVVGDNIIESLSDTKTPQGLIAIVNFSEKPLKAPNNNFVVLENLQDAGNLGTIIRSCKGTNFNDIFLINCVSFYNQKVIRSAMGNIFDVSLHSFKTTSEFLNFAKQNSLQLAVADMNGENLFKIKTKPQRLGIVIGNEGKGATQEIKDYCKRTISIPMKNNLESLNAGVSCSIIIYYLDNL